LIVWNWLKVFKRRASRFVGHINSPGFLSGVWPIKRLNMRIKSYLMKGVIIKEMIAAQTALARIGVPDDIGIRIQFGYKWTIKSGPEPKVPGWGIGWMFTRSVSMAGQGIPKIPLPSY